MQRERPGLSNRQNCCRKHIILAPRADGRKVPWSPLSRRLFPSSLHEGSISLTGVSTFPLQKQGVFPGLFPWGSFSSLEETFVDSLLQFFMSRPQPPTPSHFTTLPPLPPSSPPPSHPPASGEELLSHQLSVLGNILSVAVRELGGSRPLG